MTMITPLQLKRVFPACHDPNAWVRIFTMELPAFEITTPARLAAWIAQCGYESQSFNVLRESGAFGRKITNPRGGAAYDVYSEKRLMEIWPNKFPTLESTQPFIQQPEALLNYVYANELGNGPPNTRDGFIYRGGGLIQLTGRGNYREIGDKLGIKLEAMPKLIEQQNIAARTSCYFWKLHNLNAAADAGDIDAITKRINGAMTGAAERRAYYAAACVQFSAPPAFIKGAPPGPAPNQVRAALSPGPAPGPVRPGTLDGMHTPGNSIQLQQQQYGRPGDREQPGRAA